MRVIVVSAVVLVLTVACSYGMPQGAAEGPARPQAPRQQRPGTMSTRFRNMITGAVGDMSGVYDRVRKGFTRTFSAGGRPNGFRNVNGGEGGAVGPAFRNPPSVDPAVHTNEITPARNSEGSAPNAPNSQGLRRPAGGRRPGNFIQRVEQMMGNMRNMFQNFNRRMSGGGPTRRTQQFQQQPQIAHQQAVQSQQQQQHHQQGEFRPLS